MDAGHGEHHARLPYDHLDLRRKAAMEVIRGRVGKAIAVKKYVVG
jgi:hypothetical protein